MNENRKCIYEICMSDSSKVLTKQGFTNICQKYGPIKSVSFHKANNGNYAFVKFEHENSIYQILREKSDLPPNLTIELSNRSKEQINKHEYDEDIENCKVIKDVEPVNAENTQLKTSEGGPIYLGPNVTGSSVIEESKQPKLEYDCLYNLENNYLFGRPLTTKWEKIEKLKLELNNHDFYSRFENCTGGEIKVEKKLSPNMFTGWATVFNDGENVQNTLKSISNGIESSDFLNIKDLKRGMLVGAFDNTTNSYGRGYVTLIAGNSVNVALIDYGKVVNTVKIRMLPEKYTQLPAYSFKVYTRGNHVPQLQEKPYVFKVHSVCAKRIVLIIFVENKEVKVQLVKWQPTVEESGVPYIDFISGSSVKLLKVKNMNSVYLRSKEKQHIDFFFWSWNSVAAYCYKNPQPLNREPFYGEIVGFKSTIKNSYVRGRIYKYLGGNVYSVKHMDNPLKEDIQSLDMIELQFEQKSIPMSFLKVKMEDALPYPMQYYAKELIRILINIPLSVSFDESRKEGWKYVNLKITSLKENVNAILFGLVEPLWFKNIPTDCMEGTTDFCSYIDVPKNELKENSVLNMKFVMYHDGIYYMRDKLFDKSFSLLSSMIREYCGLSLNPYLPHPGEICVGKFQDGLWYRILCHEFKPGSLVKVHFVDLGNVAFLNTRNIKKLPIELLFHPIHVYRCTLDIPEKNVTKLELLQTYENADCEFTIVKNLGENEYIIKCPFFQEIFQ